MKCFSFSLEEHGWSGKDMGMGYWEKWIRY